MTSIRNLILIVLVVLAGCEKSEPYQSKAMEIFPAMQIKMAALFRMDQLGITQDFFRGKWTAVAFATADCLSDCHQRLTWLNEVEGHNALLVITDLAQHDQMRALKSAYPNVEISMGTTASTMDTFIEQFNDSSIPVAERQDYIYLVNPSATLTHAVLATELNPGDLPSEIELLISAGKD